MSILNQSHIDVLDPTKMSDEVATKLGLKPYFGDVSGADIDITTSAAGGINTIFRAVFYPYQTQNGGWRLKWNIAGSLNTATNVFNISLSGVTFKNIAGYFPPHTVHANYSSDDPVGVRINYVTPGTGDISFRFVESVGEIRSSGDVELDAKPTWAA